MSTIAKEEVARVDYIHRHLDELSRHDTGQPWSIITPDRVRHEYTAAEVRAWPEVKAKLLAELLAGFAAVAVSEGWQGDMYRFSPPDAPNCGKAQASVNRGLCMYRDSAAFKASQPQPIPEEMRQVAWVPKVGELVRVKCDDGAHCRGFVGRVTNAFNERLSAVCGDKHVVEVLGISHFLDDLEPADALADRLDSIIGAQREVSESELPPSFRTDPYKAHRTKLLERLIADGHSADEPELMVASAMATEDTTVDRWSPKKPTNRDRLIAALAAELDRPAPVRFPHPGRNFALRGRDE
jgi:hypothetical protein